jgi:hypothetical protein
MRRPRVGAHRRLRHLWLNAPFAMSNDMTKRLLWSGMLAGIGALTTIVANRLATALWIKLFDEDPPE